MGSREESNFFEDNEGVYLLRDVLIWRWRMVSSGNANAEYLRGMPASDTPAEEIGNCVWRIFPTPALCLFGIFVRL